MKEKCQIITIISIWHYGYHLQLSFLLSENIAKQIAEVVQQRLVVTYVVEVDLLHITNEVAQVIAATCLLLELEFHLVCAER